jgi:hypothetical protein
VVAGWRVVWSQSCCWQRWCTTASAQGVARHRWAVPAPTHCLLPLLRPLAHTRMLVGAPSAASQPFFGLHTRALYAAATWRRIRLRPGWLRLRPRWLRPRWLRPRWLRPRWLRSGSGWVWLPPSAGVRRVPGRPSSADASAARRSACRAQTRRQASSAAPSPLLEQLPATIPATVAALQYTCGPASSRIVHA